MAAYAVAMRAAYVRLGFTQEAALLITDDQGIIELEEIRLMTDPEVVNLCKVLRRPGGTMMVPNAAGVNVQVPNPGNKVSLLAENNLKMACYYLRHRARVSRAVVPVDITLANVRSIRELSTSEGKHEDPKDKPTIDETDWPRTMEAFDEYFRAYHGETGIPLAYVIREEANVPDEEPVGGYPTVQDEMITRAPHKNAANESLPVFLADRTKVWELLAALCRANDCWSHIKKAQKTHDGRMAYQLLYNHYLGPNNVENMANKAETALQDSNYRGEKKRHNFEKYVKVHVDQHAILTGLVEHGYSGIDPRSKVRHLINGIKTTELDSVKTQIMANPELKIDFERCVILYKDFILGMASTRATSELNISALTISGDGAVEDRYYDKTEYSALSDGQKDTLREKRLKRGHKGKQVDGRQKKKQKASKDSGNIKQLKRQVAKLTTIVKNSSNDNANESDAESDDGAATGKKGNRNNSALTRQKKKKN
jgi:ribosomal protein L29